MATKKNPRKKTSHAKPRAAAHKKIHRKKATVRRAKAHRPHHATHGAGVPAAVLELEGLWDDRHKIATVSHIRSVLERHGVSAAEARSMADPIRRGLARHAKAHGRAAGHLSRHKGALKTHAGAARRKAPPATEWARLWKAYTESNKSGSLRQQLAAGRRLLTFDRTHGTPALPQVATALHQAREFLRSHGRAYSEAKALHGEIQQAERAMNHHHHRVSGTPVSRVHRGLSRHKASSKPAKRPGLFALV